MIDKINKLKEQFLSEITSIKGKDGIEQLRIRYLGRKGVISELFEQLSDIPNELRPEAGKSLNKVKQLFQNEYDKLSNTFKNIIENISSCISATTQVASDFFRQNFKSSG